MLKNNAIISALLFLLLGNLHAEGMTATAQDDTVKAPECIAAPVIDGKADDACWETAPWQSIDQVWITWGQQLDPADFSGRYKVTWSSMTDRIYFLVEIVDDVLVKGYEYPMGGYYNYDVVEIFFDEDASGGDHMLNENAFAYHITAGNEEDEYQVMDNTANYAVMNYSNHFECKIVNAGGVNSWELAMIVYNEDYDPNSSLNPSEELTVGKISGLSIAYCDNDNPNENPKTRDNFIGSVAVPKSNYNDHWINADWFGKVQLVASDYYAGVIDRNPLPESMTLQQNYPNPFNPATIIRYQMVASQHVSLAIFNTTGQMIRSLVNSQQISGSYSVLWDGMTDSGDHAPTGVYYYLLQTEQGREMRKMILMR